MQIASPQIGIGKICADETRTPQFCTAEIGVMGIDVVEPRRQEARVRYQQRPKSSLAKVRAIQFCT